MNAKVQETLRQEISGITYSASQAADAIRNALRTAQQSTVATSIAAATRLVSLERALGQEHDEFRKLRAGIQARVGTLIRNELAQSLVPLNDRIEQCRSLRELLQETLTREMQKAGLTTLQADLQRASAVRRVLQEQYQTKLPALRTAATQLMADTREALEGMVDSTADLVRELGDSFESEFENVFDDAAESIQDDLSSIVEDSTEHVQGLIEQHLGTLIEDIGDDFLTTLQTELAQSLASATSTASITAFLQPYMPQMIAVRAGTATLKRILQAV
jgi:hypothetical protein